jgi:hypothetical protein
MSAFFFLLRGTLGAVTLVGAVVAAANEPALQVIDDERDPFLFHHEMTVNSFLNADGFGARRVFDSVPGLHGALNASNGPWLHGGFSYEVGVHDLMGLQKAGQPRVYPILELVAKAPEPKRYTIEELSPAARQAISLRHTLVRKLPLPTLPISEEHNIPVRELDAFEQQALPLLRAGHALVKDEQSGYLRMLGAIRAQETCLKCHDDQKSGDLLGAFTYFVTKQPAPEVETAKRVAMEKLLAEGGEAKVWDWLHEWEESYPQGLWFGGLTRLGIVTPGMIKAMRRQREALPRIKAAEGGEADPMDWEMKVEPISKSRIPAGR